MVEKIFRHPERTYGIQGTGKGEKDGAFLQKNENSPTILGDRTRAFAEKSICAMSIVWIGHILPCSHGLEIPY